MAVVQISKIQLRRGKKLEIGSVPQLSSAEMAWAVDTQELFIGNGSVAEGAPYVGNTKILTEHDNLLDLISGYRFANDDPSIVNSVTRSLQSKLDEYVSIADYGAVNDGSTDCTDQFETAFTDLFRNVDEKFRKTLIIPNGTYLFSRDLEIPSNAKIRGESRDGSVLLLENNNIRLISEQGTGLINFNSTDRPENITISNITIQRSLGQVVLSGLINGIFGEVRFRGEHFSGRTVSSLSAEPSALFWENSFLGTTVTNIHFNNCFFDSNSISVKCLQSITARSEVFFNDSYFENNNTGIYIEGTPNQDTSWKIFNCKFKEIEASAFRSTQGKNTLIESSKFINCGNGLGNAGNPITNIIFFGESKNNLVIDSKFDRLQAAGVVASSSVLAVSEVFNGSFVNIIDRINSSIFLSDSFRPLAVLSSFNKFINVKYILSLGDYNRSGTLNLVVDKELSFVGITDDFVYSDNFITSGGGRIMSNFQFSAELRNNGDLVRLDMSDSSASLETVVLLYKNPLLTGIPGEITFDVTYGV
jgi:hypothetical protein